MIKEKNNLSENIEIKFIAIKTLITITENYVYCRDIILNEITKDIKKFIEEIKNDLGLTARQRLLLNSLAGKDLI